MARLDNIYYLLKNAEVFIRQVPVDPRSPDFEDWKARRKELAKAFKGTYKYLNSLKGVALLKLSIPCQVIPIKQPSALRLNPCGKPLIRQVDVEIKALIASKKK